MCDHKQQQKQQSGFTLIELIISMLIFAIISLISYNALQAYSTNQQLIFGHMQKINNLQKTILFVKRDINQIINHGIALQANVLTLTSLQNDKVVKIRYQLENENLTRQDLSDDDNPISLTLLENIDKFEFRLLNTKNEWLSKRNDDKDIIKSIELSFENDYWGKVEQQVMLGDK